MATPPASATPARAPAAPGRLFSHAAASRLPVPIPARTAASIRANASCVPNTKSCRRRNHDHLQPQQDASPEKGRGEEARDPRRAGGGAARRGRRGRGTFRAEPVEAERHRRGHEVEARGHDGRSYEAQPGDEHGLPRHRSRHSPERVPAVEAPERHAEPRVVPRQGAGEEGQGRAHRRGGQEHQGEGGQPARPVEQTRRLPETGERRRETLGEAREARTRPSPSTATAVSRAA